MDASNLELLGLPLPLTIHPDTLRDPQLRVASTDGAWFAIWCPRHAAGAVYDRAGGLWSIVVPIPLDAFIGTLRASGVRLPGDGTLQAWVDACAAAPLAASRH